MDNLKFWLILNAVPGLGTRKAKLLLEQFGSPRTILTASPSKLREVPGINLELAGQIANWKHYINLEKEFTLIDKHQATIITIEDKNYPESLSNIFDSPLVIYMKGDIIPQDHLAIAIVGARRSSLYGKMTAEKLGRELAAKGLTVVSGLARGVDSAAHKGALSGNGRTIAVLGSGLDVVYPPENKDLLEKIADGHGAVISEFSMSTRPEKWNFPRRNRIISGLSLGVVVIEAAKRSGALITADFALEQGREVFALPGKVDSLTSQGTNKLIQQGAKLVTTSDDIIEELQPLFADRFTDTENSLPLPSLQEEEEKLYNLLSDEPKHLDTFIKPSGLSAGRIASLLLKLQMKKLTKELPGKMFVKI